MKSLFIIGPSGVGKSTLCEALHYNYAEIFGEANVLTINLDCANLVSKCKIDINKLITLEDIMEEEEIGPNGSLLFSIDFLWQNIKWLYEQIDQVLSVSQPAFKVIKNSPAMKQKIDQTYSFNNIIFIFDLPGQPELYLSHDSMKKIIKDLTKVYSLNACVVELFDATYIYEITNLVSMIMMSLSSMINLEMPHLNLLNKIDVLKGRRPGLGMLNDYFSLASVKEIVSDLNGDQQNKIITQLAKIIDQFGQVSFVPSSSYNQSLLMYIIFQLEKIFGTLEFNIIGNKKFSKMTKSCQQEFAFEKLINELQGQLFAEQQQIDYQKFFKEMKK